MAKDVCHQCGAEGKPARKGLCRFCYSKSVPFCKDCAWWELGPLPAVAGLPDSLRPHNQTTGSPKQKCPLGKPPSPPPETPLLDEICAACALIKGQVDHGGFDADKAAHGHGYQRDDGYPYAPPSPRTVKGGLDSPEPDQTPGFHPVGGAAAGFGDLVNKALATYDAIYGGGPGGPEKHKMMRTLVVAYASAQERCGYVNDIYVHRYDAPRFAAAHLGFCLSAFLPVPKLGIAQKALSTVVLEQALLGKISLANSYWVLRDLAGGDAAVAKEIIEIATVVFHVWTAVRPLDGKEAKFSPHRAHGYLTAATKQELLSKDGKQFTKKAQATLGALYACFDGAHVPAGINPASDPRIRFYDAGVQGDPGLETAKQRYFLQSLPKMDGIAPPTPCELVVRNRVLKRLEAIAAAATVAPSCKRRGSPFERFEKCKDKVWLASLLDLLIQDMNSTTYWIESSMRDRTFESYYLPDGSDDFYIKSQTQVDKRDVKWQHVFPDCAGAPTTTEPGLRSLPHLLAYENDGRESAKRHYLDWRNDKDQYMYDCFNFSYDERPVFASYSLWPRAPEPNHTYGDNMIVWDGNVAKRSVLCLGDKGVVYRSRLLLLQDLLCKVPSVTGEFPDNGSKARTLQGILLHLERNTPHRAHDKAALRALLDAGYVGRFGPLDVAGTPPTDSGQPVIVQDRFDSGNTLIIECHVFGKLKVNRDAWAIVVDLGKANPGVLETTLPRKAWITQLRALGKGYHVIGHRTGIDAAAIRPTPIPTILTGDGAITAVNAKVPDAAQPTATPVVPRVTPVGARIAVLKERTSDVTGTQLGKKSGQSMAKLVEHVETILKGLESGATGAEVDELCRRGYPPRQVFVAAEWYFRPPERPCTLAEYTQILDGLTGVSRRHPAWLLLPGTIYFSPDPKTSRTLRVYNQAVVLCGGHILHKRTKWNQHDIPSQNQKREVWGMNDSTVLPPPLDAAAIGPGLFAHDGLEWAIDICRDHAVGEGACDYAQHKNTSIGAHVHVVTANNTDLVDCFITARDHGLLVYCEGGKGEYKAYTIARGTPQSALAALLITYRGLFQQERACSLQLDVAQPRYNELKKTEAYLSFNERYGVVFGGGSKDPNKARIGAGCVGDHDRNPWTREAYFIDTVLAEDLVMDGEPISVEERTVMAEYARKAREQGIAAYQISQLKPRVTTAREAVAAAAGITKTEVAAKSSTSDVVIFEVNLPL